MMTTPLPAPRRRSRVDERAQSTGRASGGVREPAGRVARAGLAILTSLAVAGCSWLPWFTPTAAPSPSAPPTGTSGQPSAGPSPRTSVTISLPSGSTSPTPSPTSSQPSASSQLAGFVSRARSVDAAVRAAAKRINGSITATTVRVTSGTAHAVDSIDLDGLARSIPAGMPGPLLRQTILVYSELVSRRAAFNHLFYLPRNTPVPRHDPQVQDMITCLGHGSAAAARFAADLKALVALANATPRFTKAAQNSTATAELLLRIQYIDKGNNGCDACGGYVATTLAAIIWKASSSSTERAGTIGGVDFTATYHTSNGWTVEIIAC